MSNRNICPKKEQEDDEREAHRRRRLRDPHGKLKSVRALIKGLQHHDDSAARIYCHAKRPKRDKPGEKDGDGAQLRRKPHKQCVNFNMFLAPCDGDGSGEDRQNHQKKHQLLRPRDGRGKEVAPQDIGAIDADDNRQRCRCDNGAGIGQDVADPHQRLTHARCFSARHQAVALADLSSRSNSSFSAGFRPDTSPPMGNMSFISSSRSACDKAFSSQTFLCFSLKSVVQG